MNSTEELINSLGGQLAPVRRLRPPLARALGWIAFGTLLVAVLVALRGLRPDLESQLRDPAFLLKLGGAWLTAATATLAAFEISLPDRRGAWLLLSLPAAGPWLFRFSFWFLGHLVCRTALVPVLAA